MGAFELSLASSSSHLSRRLHNLALQSAELVSLPKAEPGTLCVCVCVCVCANFIYTIFIFLTLHLSKFLFHSPLTQFYTDPSARFGFCLPSCMAYLPEIKESPTRPFIKHRIKCNLKRKERMGWGQIHDLPEQEETEGTGPLPGQHD